MCSFHCAHTATLFFRWLLPLAIRHRLRLCARSAARIRLRFLRFAGAPAVSASPLVRRERTVVRPLVLGLASLHLHPANRKKIVFSPFPNRAAHSHQKTPLKPKHLLPVQKRLCPWQRHGHNRFCGGRGGTGPPTKKNENRAFYNNIYCSCVRRMETYKMRGVSFCPCRYFLFGKASHYARSQFCRIGGL